MNVLFSDAGDFAEVGASSGSTVFLASPASSNSTPRRNCFMIDIIDDEVVESVESFTLVLDLEPFQVQSAVLVQPNVTVISIIDDDSKYALDYMIPVDLHVATSSPVVCGDL